MQPPELGHNSNHKCSLKAKLCFLLLGPHANSFLNVFLSMITIWWNPGVNGPWERTLFLCSQLLFGSFPGHSGCQSAELPARQTVRDNGPEGPTGVCSAQPDQRHRGAPRRSPEALGTAAGSLCSPQTEVAREAAAPTAGKNIKIKIKSHDQASIIYLLVMDSRNGFH